MKKTQFAKPEYSVAMSVETGCIVMVKKGPRGAEVIGSLSREDSLRFCQGLIEWIPEVLLAESIAETPKLSLVN